MFQTPATAKPSLFGNTKSWSFLALLMIAALRAAFFVYFELVLLHHTLVLVIFTDVCNLLTLP